MSGPKVVRIVTREEILAMCQGILARVDAALDEWLRIGGRNEVLDDDAIATAKRRRDALAALIAADRFIDFQKQAPIEEGFLREDIQRRLSKAAEAQAEARSKERREREAAGALLRALQAKNVAVDKDLKAALERGDPAATSRGLLMLGGAAPIEADKRVAAVLGQGVATETFAAWVSQQPAQPGDPAVERIERRIAEISQFAGGDGDQLASWRARLLETDSAITARRHLVLDALEVETGRALSAARQKARLLSDLRLVAAEAGATGLPTDAWLVAVESLSAEDIERRFETAVAALEAHRNAKAVDARRAAVLQGLSGLGYEVTEGMTTAWASQGRLVVKSAARPDYGVELSGDSRFQMRPVAFDVDGRGPDPSRDRDAETIWCGDVSSLDRSLATVGGRLEIEKSFPVGAVALKRIAVRTDNAATAESTITGQLRKVK